jgi:unsaturated rhamnogalacturonyl hydrolase
MKFTKTTIFSLIILANSALSFAQNASKQVTDSNTPMYLIPPDYPVPYGIPDSSSVKSAIDRIYNFLNSCTPTQLKNKLTGNYITDFSKPDTSAIIEAGTFRLTSYEWGVTYGAMLKASEVTGNSKYADYTKLHLDFLMKCYNYYKILWDKGFKERNPFARIIEPKALDDCGALSCSFIKEERQISKDDYTPIIKTGVDFIRTKEHRLADGTLARMRPQANTVWLDDMYMGIPCMAQMGALTGESVYYDEAATQILKFAEKMFVPEKGLFRHGWVEGMATHPSFHWGRANGWAILTLCEVLDVLPKDHKNRDKILELFRTHAENIAKYQSSDGFWHQLIDRNDSYEETSATAIFTYCLAHGINKGWLDAKALGPQAILGWNALSTKINASGQVEGTCVGTGMGFDPAFYYYRPVRALAAHGYGPAILAASETLLLLKNYQIVINETSVMLYNKSEDWKNLQIK